jgi:lysophospholipid acyltransferase
MAATMESAATALFAAVDLVMGRAAGWAAPATLRFVWLNGVVASVAGALGVRADGVRVMVHLLLSFPLSYILKRLPSAAARHAFAAVVGLLVLQFLVSVFWVHAVGLSVVTYVLLRLLRPGVLCNVVVFAVALAWLALTHLYRMSHLDNDYDPSAAQMVLIIKVTSLTFNLYDAHADRHRPPPATGTHLGDRSGRDGAARATTRAQQIGADVGHATELAAAPGADLPAAEKSMSAGGGAGGAGRDDAILAQRRRLALDAVPGPLAYAGYMLLFTTVFTGPAFTYREYTDTMEGSRMRRERARVVADAVAAHKTATVPDPLSSTGPALRAMVQALVFFLVHVIGAMYFPLSCMWSDVPTVIGTSAPARLLALWLAMLVERAKYYFAWGMAEGASVMAEFGYHGRDAAGRARWDAINNMDVLSFELSGSPRDASVRWNRVTGQWLRHYVFERLPPGPLQLWALYFVSALWHGFYPGYYAFFLSAAVMQEGVKGIRTHVRPWFARHPTAQRVYDVAGVVATSLAVAYFGAAFMAMYVDRTLLVWGRVYYIGHVILVPAALVALLLPAPARRKHKAS